MWSRVLSRLPSTARTSESHILTWCHAHVRPKTTRHSEMKVCICGASNQVGQPLALLLKQSHLIDTLTLYDGQSTQSTAMELHHIDTKCKVSMQQKELQECLQDASVVAICSAAPNTSNKQMSAMFELNAPVVRDVMGHVARHAPKALVAIATNPVNCMVPIAHEVMKLNNVNNPRKLFGVTTLNVVRANTFVAEALGLEPECVNVPVIGGHHRTTIVPLLSQAVPCKNFTLAEIEKITLAVQTAHDDVLKVKQHDSATLSTAFAIARFVIALVKAIKGFASIEQCAYVRTDIHPAVKYLAIPVTIGPDGVQKYLGIPRITDYEQCLLDNAIPLIGEDITKAEKFVGTIDDADCDPCSYPPPVKMCPVDQCKRGLL